MSERQYTLVELWAALKVDMEKFISDRPGWLIDVLKQAREKGGRRGWQDVETVMNILQFLRDTEVEY